MKIHKKNVIIGNNTIKRYKFPKVSKDFSSINKKVIKFFRLNLSLYGKLKNKIYEKFF